MNIETRLIKNVLVQVTFYLSIYVRRSKYTYGKQVKM